MAVWQEKIGRLEDLAREAMPLPDEIAFQHQVEEQGVMFLDLRDDVGRLRIKQPKLLQLMQGEQGQDAGQGIIGAVQQTVVQIVREQQRL